MIKFGFPVWYGGRPLRTAIEKAYKLGFDYIEFDLNPPSLEKLTKQESTILESLKEEYNLELAFHGPWSGVDITNLNEKISETSLSVIMDAIKFSENFKPAYFNFHISGLSNPHLLCLKTIKNEIYKKALTNTQRIIDASKISLTLENNGTNPIFKTPREFNIFKPYKINFCLDIGHAIKNKYQLDKPKNHNAWEIKNWFNSFKDKIYVVHLHDCLIKNNEVVDHLPIGNGNLNFDKIFDSLKHAKSKYMLLEFAKMNHKSLDFCKKNLR